MKILSSVAAGCLVVLVGLSQDGCSARSEDTGADEEAQSVLHQQDQDRAWGYRRKTAAAGNHFLVQHGAGSLAESNAYYGLIIPGFTPDTFTLQTWRSQFIANAPTVTGFYRNRTELGFWRDMTCTQIIRRGAGGCVVTNWQNETDKANGLPNKGTVAMNVSPAGFTRFYIFLPSGVLSPSAVLDSEGPKFAPRLCTVCHGGFNVNPGQSGDLGSIFREFQVSELDPRSGISRAQAEQEWFDLNQAVRSANESIRAESEGSAAGVDHAKAAMSAFLDVSYPNLAPPARGIGDAALVPTSWQGATARTQLWTSVVSPYCMGCHRHNALDWSSYANFKFLRTKQNGTGLLRSYTTVVNGAHDLPYMPQAELAFTTLGADPAAQAGIDGWLAGCASGKSCAPTSNPCHVGKTKCTSGESTCTDTGASLADGTACGSHLVCAKGACVPDASCNRAVLVLGDSASGDAFGAPLVQALTAAGLTPTFVDNGASSYDGTTAAASFGAILITPGLSSSTDMNPSGQQAVVSANAAGTGVVFTEWAAYHTTQSRYQLLAPLVLMGRSTGTNGTGTFTLSVPSHPIWTGLPTTISTASSFGYSIGAPTNGGVAIANLQAPSQAGAGVVVRDGTGRVVHIAHAGNYVHTAGWEANDPSTTLMLTNALRWAARCL